MARKPKKPRGYRASGRHPITIKGLDPRLRQWLKVRAVLEGCTIGELVNSIILRYRDEVGWSQSNAPRPPGPRPSLTVRGLNLELWQWARERAAQENKYVGDLINDLLRHHIATGGFGESSLPDFSPPTGDPEYIVNIPGVDRTLWQHLKDGADLEQKTIGEALNHIIAWYRRVIVRP